MPESVRDRYARWLLEELLLQQRGLRIVPSADDGVTLVGLVCFRAVGPHGVEIEDSYELELRVPADFPRRPASVRETGGRIPDDYHKLKDGCLCLGAPTEIAIVLARSPTLPGFVARLLIPYLYGYSYFKSRGVMPFGELDHGANGLLQHFATLFGVSSHPAARQFVRLASLRRRAANKRPCPCGSGRRLGRCHSRRVNRLRGELGRGWFRRQLVMIEAP